jgi:hexosaminidase
MRSIALVFISCFATALTAQEINIIPQPVSVKQPKIAGSFAVTPATTIVLEGSGLENSVDFFNDYLQQFYHFKLKTAKSSTSKNVIVLNYERMDNKLAGAYTLKADNKGVYIAGDNETAVFYGIQTLIQLLPVVNTEISTYNSQLPIPFVSITDYPRFGYRGLMLDVGRHFFPVEFVKKYIDFIALHKMNYFHWHLTEDQGWRIEIKKYPRLTETGAWRNGTIIGHNPGTGSDNTRHGGFYTQEEIKEVIAYAKKRYITIIPEIEMPGHGSAAIAAYPWLSCFPAEPTKISENASDISKAAGGKQVQEKWGVFEDVFCAGNDSTFSFLQDVLDEVIALFPSTYIHVGGDECPKTNWKRCPKCQARMQQLGLKTEHELQSYFIQRMEKYINKKHRKLIGWDEILEGGLAQNATVMSWRGEKGGIEAAKQNHDVVMTPTTYVYFDYSQTKHEDSLVIGGFLPLEKVYSYEPIPPVIDATQAKYILGGQANLWTEYTANPQKIEYMIFPRLTALSEVLWSPKEKKDYSDFGKRLEFQFKRYELWKVAYSKAYYDTQTSAVPAVK